VSYDPITEHEVELLEHYVKSFKFICSTVIWYSIFDKVNIAHKVLQKNEAALEILTNIQQYLKKRHSDNDFDGILIDGRETDSSLDVEHTFLKKIL
jgi:hypothetical protein